MRKLDVVSFPINDINIRELLPDEVQRLQYPTTLSGRAVYLEGHEGIGLPQNFAGGDPATLEVLIKEGDRVEISRIDEKDMGLQFACTGFDRGYPRTWLAFARPIERLELGYDEHTDGWQCRVVGPAENLIDAGFVEVTASLIVANALGLQARRGLHING